MVGAPGGPPAHLPRLSGSTIYECCCFAQSFEAPGPSVSVRINELLFSEHEPTVDAAFLKELFEELEALKRRDPDSWRKATLMLAVTLSRQAAHADASRMLIASVKDEFGEEFETAMAERTVLANCGIQGGPSFDTVRRLAIGPDQLETLKLWEELESGASPREAVARLRKSGPGQGKGGG